MWCFYGRWVVYSQESRHTYLAIERFLRTLLKFNYLRKITNTLGANVVIHSGGTD